MKYMPEFRFRLDTSYDKCRQDRRAAAKSPEVARGSRHDRSGDKDEE